MTLRTLDRDVIDNLLRELARRIHERGIPAGIRVIGGAAIALPYLRDRRATTDVDATLSPVAPVLEVAAEMAVEHDLPPDWLNDRAKMFVPFAELNDWIELYREGDVVVPVASASMLLAMKLAASRGIRDADDITGLLAICGITSVEHAQELYERYHAQEVLPPRAVARIERYVASLADLEDGGAASLAE